MNACAVLHGRAALIQIFSVFGRKRDAWDGRRGERDVGKGDLVATNGSICSTPAQT